MGVYIRHMGEVFGEQTARGAFLGVQNGPLPVINEVITPLIGFFFTPVPHLFSGI